MAKFYQPSIIFIDEFDGLSSKRDASTEHEASKRFKNEFLIQMDGINDAQVFLLASTNIPWSVISLRKLHYGPPIRHNNESHIHRDIDAAFLRRFEKKLLVGLPNDADRWHILCHFLPQLAVRTITTDEQHALSTVAKGFTGNDLRIACKEIAMRKIRHAIETKSGIDSTMLLATITTQDLKQVLAAMAPSTALHLMAKHTEWNQSYGN